MIKKYGKKLSLCNKSQFSNTYISTTKLCKSLIFYTLIVWYNRKFEISKVYNIWLLRYRDLKIRVCCRDSIPFETLRFNLNGVWFTEILILWSIYSTLRIKDLSQRNWVSVTNSDFLIPISLQPVVVLYLDISNLNYLIQQVS